MPTYYEKLSDPRWQKKRLQIMERAGFKCELCGNGRATLSVHHGCYLKGKDPWGYENGQYHCLCEKCHEIAGEASYALNWVLGHLTPDSLDRVAGYACQVLGFDQRHGLKSKILSVSTMDGMLDYALAIECMLSQEARLEGFRKHEGQWVHTPIGLYGLMPSITPKKEGKNA